MSDYTQITDFSDKDGRTTGDPEKIILGADFDGEFSAIQSAVSTKYDSGDIASAAQATAGLLDTVLMTPLQVDNVLSQNSAVVKSALSLADPAADRIFFWDDGAAAGSEAAWLTVGDGLEISATTLQLPASLAGAGLSLTAGVLAVDLTEAALATPAGADKILFADAGSADALSYATWTNMQADISITESQVSDLGTYLSSGDTAASLTITSLATSSITETLTSGITVASVVESQDGILITDNGNVEVMNWNDGGVHVETFAADDEIDDTMYSLYMLLTGGTGKTMTFNSATNAAHTGAVVLLGTRDTATLTLAVSGTSKFTSTLEQGGTTSRSIVAGGTAMAIHVGSDEWMLVGDIS